jgi:hypothetical protein
LASFASFQGIQRPDHIFTKKEIKTKDKKKKVNPKASFGFVKFGHILLPIISL